MDDGIDNTDINNDSPENTLRSEDSKKKKKKKKRNKIGPTENENIENTEATPREGFELVED